MWTIWKEQRNTSLIPKWLFQHSRPTCPCGGGREKGSCHSPPFPFPLPPFKMLLLTVTANQLWISNQKYPEHNRRPLGMVFKIKYDLCCSVTNNHFMLLVQLYVHFLGEIISLSYTARHQKPPSLLSASICIRARRLNLASFLCSHMLRKKAE